MADFNFNFRDRNYEPSNDFNFGFSVTVYKLLAGTSNDYTSIWADTDANIETANMYVGTAGTGAAFSVVDLEHVALIDSYSLTEDGQNKEYLDSEDIVDINVNMQG